MGLRTFPPDHGGGRGALSLSWLLRYPISGTPVIVHQGPFNAKFAAPFVRKYP